MNPRCQADGGRIALSGILAVGGQPGPWPGNQRKALRFRIVISTVEGEP